MPGPYCRLWRVRFDVVFAAAAPIARIPAPMSIFVAPVFATAFSVPLQTDATFCVSVCV
jgi:hypothetical protein